MDYDFDDSGSLVVAVGIGLRAAVVIASERERGTWDALLTSPLEGDQIVGPKVWGSLYALRWLIAWVIVSWTMAMLCGAMEYQQYFSSLGETLVVGWFVTVRT